MAIFNEYLISYDIEDNKNRNKLYDELKNLGLTPIQKSVFWGNLLKSEERMLPNLFKKYCKNKNDKAFYVQVKLSKQILKNSIGYSESDFEDKGFNIV